MVSLLKKKVTKNKRRGQLGNYKLFHLTSLVQKDLKYILKETIYKDT